MVLTLLLFVSVRMHTHQKCTTRMRAFGRLKGFSLAGSGGGGWWMDPIGVFLSFRGCTF